MRTTRAILALVLGAIAVAACAERSPAPEKPAAPAVDTAATATVVAEKPAPEAPAVVGRGEGAYPGFQVPAFKATARFAAEQSFDSHARTRPTLYIINSAKCPSCREYVDRIKAIEAMCAAGGVDVVHVYPNRTETDAEKIAWHKAQGFAGGQILDESARISKSLEAERTPTAYLADARGLIVYRGGVDSSSYDREHADPYLADALGQFLAHRPIVNDTTEPSG